MGVSPAPAPGETYDLSCDLAPPLAVGARPNYALHRRAPAPLPTDDDGEHSYRWTLRRRAGGPPLVQSETHVPRIAMTLPLPGLLRAEVEVLERGRPTGIHLAIDHSVAPAPAAPAARERDELHDRDHHTETFRHPEPNTTRALRELIDDFRKDIIDAATATGDHGITALFLAATLFPEIEATGPFKRNGEETGSGLLLLLERAPWLRVAAFAASGDSGAYETIDKQVDEGLNLSLGVGQIEPSTAAMVLKGPDGKPLTPWVEQDRDNPQPAIDEIKKAYKELPPETKHLIHAMLTHPLLNIDTAAKLLTVLKNREHRFPELTAAAFERDEHAVRVVGTEYNRGGTTTPARDAGPSDYGDKVWDAMQQPLFRTQFPTGGE